MPSDNIAMSNCTELGFWQRGSCTPIFHVETQAFPQANSCSGTGSSGRRTGGLGTPGRGSGNGMPPDAPLNTSAASNNPCSAKMGCLH
eukprot:4421988-Amphidinium_carterae.1